MQELEFQDLMMCIQNLPTKAWTDKDIESLDKRLSGPGFRERAKPAVVEEFEGKLAAGRERHARLLAARAQLA